MSVMTEACENIWKTSTFCFWGVKRWKTQNVLVVFALFGSLNGKLYPISTHDMSENCRKRFPGVLQQPTKFKSENIGRKKVMQDFDDNIN